VGTLERKVILCLSGAVVVVLPVLLLAVYSEYRADNKAFTIYNEYGLVTQSVWSIVCPTVALWLGGLGVGVLTLFDDPRRRKRRRLNWLRQTFL